MQTDRRTVIQAYTVINTNKLTRIQICEYNSQTSIPLTQIQVCDFAYLFSGENSSSEVERAEDQRRERVLDALVASIGEVFARNTVDAQKVVGVVTAEQMSHLYVFMYIYVNIIELMKKHMNELI